MLIQDSEKPALLRTLQRVLVHETDREVNGELSEHALWELEQIRTITARLIDEGRRTGSSERLIFLADYNLSQAELLNMGLVDLMRDPFHDLNRYAHSGMGIEPGKGMLMVKAMHFLRKKFSQ